jgi:hypothetical protein
VHSAKEPGATRRQSHKCHLGSYCGSLKFEPELDSTPHERHGGGGGGGGGNRLCPCVCILLCSCKAQHTIAQPLPQHAAQSALSACIPLCSCKAEPSLSLGMVLRNTLTQTKHAAQVILSVCIPLCSCKAVQSHSLRLILRNIYSIMTIFKLFAQVELSICIPRSSCKVEQSPGLYMVLRDTKTYSDASSQRVLAKVAARCSAIPCKREPFSLSSATPAPTT